MNMTIETIPLDDVGMISLELGIPAFVSCRGQPVLVKCTRQPWEVYGRKKVSAARLLEVRDGLESAAARFPAGRLRDSMLKAAEVARLAAGL